LAADRKVEPSLINARAKMVAVKPAFRTAFKTRRCLIPAGGFHKWKKIGVLKIPHRIMVGDGFSFFAGLWETWNDSESGSVHPSDRARSFSRRGIDVRLILPAQVAPASSRTTVRKW
jgi:putative SOS response-associated peptidase YedK